MLGDAATLDAPIFRRTARGGSAEALRTGDVRRIVRGVAEAAGEDPTDFGAHSLRIAAGRRTSATCVTRPPSLASRSQSECFASGAAGGATSRSFTLARHSTRATRRRRD